MAASAAAQRTVDQAQVPAVVDTEIGPLPADLWQLVGAPLPDTAPGPVPTMPAVQRSPAPATTDGQVGVRQVQRDETGEAASRSVSTTTPEAGQVELAAGETPTDAEVEALARLVYHRLRRRLAVEWERGRGR